MYELLPQAVCVQLQYGMCKQNHLLRYITQFPGSGNSAMIFHKLVGIEYNQYSDVLNSYKK